MLRELPSIDRLLKLPAVIEMVAEYGRSLTLEALRHTLEIVRADILNGANPDAAHNGDTRWPKMPATGWTGH
jgi:hypothetical protein